MTTLSADFEFAVGDFVCMTADADDDTPAKLQVTHRLIEQTFDSTRLSYAVRRMGHYQHDHIAVQPQELSPYPDADTLASRQIAREAQREETREAIKRFRALRAQGMTQDEANAALNSKPAAATGPEGGDRC